MSDKQTEENQITEKVIMKKRKKSLFSIIVKILAIIILICAIILAIGIGAAYWYVNDKLSKIQVIEIEEEELGISEETQQQLSGYRNIALFGVDSRELDYGKGNRSDCIIIASINNDTKEVKLFSVYRDTYMQIEGHGLDKVTHAYSYGEAPLALKTLNTNLDLNITEFVTVNFEAVSDAVDALGGIEIDITSEEVKYINSYIDEVSRVTGKKKEHITTPGMHTLDGVQAVSYSRIRYTSGGDYKRAERMRTVIAAMINKVKTKNIKEIDNLANQILPKVYTNISVNEWLLMVPELLNYKVSTSTGWPYETRGITLDRWYGVPVTLVDNVVRLHKEIFGDENYILPDSVKSISDSIVKKTGYGK